MKHVFDAMQKAKGKMQITRNVRQLNVCISRLAFCITRRRVRGALRVVLCVATAVLVSSPASAQVDLSGIWGPLYHEDQPERIPGPSLGDYLGLPITDGARRFAESWDSGRLSVPEHQCRVHTVPYIYRGPLRLRIWEERDPVTQRPVAIMHRISTFEQLRTIWMDGRPHPSPYARHTWMGFSTGQFVGDTLVVKTTHIKQNWYRRNGLPQSDKATLTEYFARHGDVLTRTSIVEDPVYLTEPLIKSENFVRAVRPAEDNWVWPCEYTSEVARSPEDVPHYLPGSNPYLTEFSKPLHIPSDVASGGAEQMYPEYMLKLKELLGKTSPPAR
jgi:hypothetical protein